MFEVTTEVLLMAQDFLDVWTAYFENEGHTLLRNVDKHLPVETQPNISEHSNLES
jgi:hypothetical protein